MTDHFDRWTKGEISTTDGSTPKRFDAPVPDDTVTDGKGMNASYWVLSAAERAKGFVRPVRRSYKHLKCGSVTTMGVAIAETYARDPKFYGATYCVECGGHFPVGADGEFTWDGTTEKVGT